MPVCPERESERKRARGKTVVCMYVAIYGSSFPFSRSIPELVIEFVRRASEPTISPFNIASFGSRSFDLREYL